MQVRRWHQEPMARLWLLLAACHVLYSLCFNPHVYFAEDDVLYQVMTKSFAEYGSLFIKNGYDEFPSSLFTYMFFYLPRPDGSLASQFPPGFAIFGTPFFWLAGTSGLFLLNALLMALSTWLTYRVALRLFAQPMLAHAAAAVYALATFAWPLSQTALAHMLPLTLVLLGFEAALRATQASACREWLLGLAAGLCVGLALTVRIDAGFALAGVAAPMAFTRPFRLRGLVAMSIGFGVMLLWLAAVNQIKFGAFDPFTYGPSRQRIFNYETYILPLGLMLTAVGSAFLWFWMPREQREGATGLFFWVLAALIAYEIVMFLPDNTWKRMMRLLWDTGLRIRMRETYERALVQGMPYLVVLPLGAWLALRDRASRLPYFLCAIIPLTYCLVISLNGFRSNAHFYQRYLASALPFLAIMTAHALWMLPRFSRQGVLALLLSGVVLAIALDFGMHGLGDIYDRYDMYMELPRFVALLLLACCLLHALSMRFRILAAIRPATGALTLFIIAATSYQIVIRDQIIHVAQLRTPYWANAELAAHVKSNALLIVGREQLRYFAPFLDVRGLRLGMQPRDKLNVSPEEVVKVVNYFHERHHEVYTFLGDPGTRIPAHLKDNGYQSQQAVIGNNRLLHWGK